MPQELQSYHLISIKSMEKIIVTGINSKLATNFVSSCNDIYEIKGITTSIESKNYGLEKIYYLSYQDEELKKSIYDANVIIHFGWSRNSNSNKENINLINYLLKNKNTNSKLIFISSISASPRAISFYSRQKYEVSKIVSKKNQTNVILGMIDDNNSDQFNTLFNFLNILPFSIRFKESIFNFYTIEQKSFNNKLLQLISSNKKYENVILTDQVFEDNLFFEYLEDKFDIDKKYKLYIPIFVVYISIKLSIIFNYFLRSLNYKQNIFDKFLTLCSKDKDWLSKIDRI